VTTREGNGDPGEGWEARERGGIGGREEGRGFLGEKAEAGEGIAPKGFF